MNNRHLVTALAAIALTSCATSPKKIDAAYVSSLTYKNLSCQDVDTEMAAVTARGEQLYSKLNRRAGRDTFNMTLGLVFSWPALLFIKGNNAQTGEFAQLKGQYQALKAAKESCVPATTVAASPSLPKLPNPGDRTIRALRADTPSGYCLYVPPGVAYDANMGPPTKARPLCPAQQAQ